MQRRLETLFCYLVKHPVDGEGILCRRSNNAPMIADTLERLEEFRSEAIHASEGLGMKVSIGMFKRINP